MLKTALNWFQSPLGGIKSASIDKILILLVALFIYCYVFYLPFTPFFFYTDQLTALYEANLMFNGQILYKDFWDFIFPGITVFYALAFAIFGTKYWIASAAIILTGTTLFWLTLRISKEVIHGPLYLLPPLIYIFFGYRWFGIDGYHRMFSPIFILVAIWILLKKAGFWNCIWAGVSCAAASFFTQQRGLITLCVLILFVVLDGYFNNEKTARTAKSVAGLCLGFLTAILLLCGYFIFEIGIQEFFYTTFVYPGKYYRYAPVNNYGVYISDWKKVLNFSTTSGLFAVLPFFFYTVVLPLTDLVVVAVFFFRHRSKDWAFWRNPLLCLIVGVALMVSSTGPNAFRLFQIALPSLIVFVWVTSYIVTGVKMQRALLYPVVGGLLILGAVQVVQIQTHWQIDIWHTPTGDIALIDSSYKKSFLNFKEITKSGDYFFDPVGPALLFPLQLRNPTRYYQLWNNDYTRPEMVNEAVSGLRQNPPRYIQWDNRFSVTSEQRSAGDHLAPLYEFLLAEYEPIGEPYGEDNLTQLWRRKGVSEIRSEQ